MSLCLAENAVLPSSINTFYCLARSHAEVHDRWMISNNMNLLNCAWLKTVTNGEFKRKLANAMRIC